MRGKASAGEGVIDMREVIKSLLNGKPERKEGKVMRWNEYEVAAVRSLPNEVHARGDNWDDYEAVNDAASGKRLPNEGHAVDEDWADYEAVNDAASGKRLPNEGHATGERWEDFENVNDPASNKSLPNEGHAA